jgi:hypothetical protein
MQDEDNFCISGKRNDLLNFMEFLAEKAHQMSGLGDEEEVDPGNCAFLHWDSIEILFLLAPDEIEYYNNIQRFKDFVLYRQVSINYNQHDGLVFSGTKNGYSRFIENLKKQISNRHQISEIFVNDPDSTGAALVVEKSVNIVIEIS